MLILDLSLSEPSQQMTIPGPTRSHGSILSIPISIKEKSKLILPTGLTIKRLGMHLASPSLLDSSPPTPKVFSK